jgi:hypothetical protein
MKLHVFAREAGFCVFAGTLLRLHARSAQASFVSVCGAPIFVERLIEPLT